MSESFFSETLMNWNKYENDRKMPWKGEKNPYKIWISEIILQQTRVQQGLEYYNRFIKAFPDVHHISSAPESNVFKLWEGLGYYSRCKNIIATAKYISSELNGKFPSAYEEIIRLKGIGSYTASAIASFAYNLPYAVLDGNVFRVLSRFFGVDIPIDSTEGKKHYSELANKLLDKKNPGQYNQAIMDFGAVICLPKQPLCDECPLQQKCIAYLKGLVNILPVRQKKIIRKVRWFYYLIIEFEDKVYTRKRTQKDIWQNLYEFVLIETDRNLSFEKLKKSILFQNIFGSAPYEIITISPTKTWQLTHQIIHGRFLKINVTSPVSIEGYELVTQEELNRLPFPKFISSYLKD